MRLAMIPIVLFLASALSTASAADQELETRFGTVRVVAEGQNPVVHKVQVGSRTLLKFEGEKVELRDVLQDDARDFVIVREHFGVSACPYNFAILEISDGGARISPEFGTCSDAESANLVSGKVLVAMPFYAEHTEARDARDLKAARTKLLVYSWGGGRLGASEKTRKAE